MEDQSITGNPNRVASSFLCYIKTGDKGVGCGGHWARDEIVHDSLDSFEFFVYLIHETGDAGLDPASS